MLLKFGNCVPCLYPLDLLERLSAVDIVQRLGIDRHFEKKIKEALDYVHRALDGRESPVAYLEITAMGFRILRMYQYDVSADVLENFKNFKDENGHFYCPDGQAQKQVQHTLDFSWHSNLPRLEARRCIQLYRHEDARLGKILYTMPNVSNEKFLELAKLDFNIKQAIHQTELKEITRWFKQSGLTQLSFAQWPFTKIASLVTVIDDIFDTYGTVDELGLFAEAVKRWDFSLVDSLPDYMKICFKIWYKTANELPEEAQKEQGRDLLGFFEQLYEAQSIWEDCIGAFLQEAEWTADEYVPTWDAYIKNGITSTGQHAVILSSMFLTGQLLPDHILQQIDFPSKFMELVGLITRLIGDTKSFKAEKARGELASSIECYMKDNPGSTEEAALDHIYGLINNCLKEFKWEFLKPNNVPLCVKKLLFNSGRLALFIYKYGDGLSISGDKIKDHITEILIEPMPV
eukprot:Gb_20080 [translate_table: standard]